MAKMESVVDSSITGQAQVYEHMLAFADSMALKCAVELRVPDIIHSHGGQATLSQIASSIGGAPASGVAYLARFMRLLVRNKVFSVEYQTTTSESVYGLTEVSRWLLTQGSPGGLTLAPTVLFFNHPEFVAPWHQFSQSARDGGSPFEKAHGCTIWELASKSPDLNKVFNDGLACTTPIIARGIANDATCKDVFGSNIGSLVDVGGGVGTFLSEIIKLYPHIKRGVNYDLPHVIRTAPQWEGVTHVAGNMFEAIPEADAIVMKGVLHDWDDEHCVKILKNCRKSIDEKTGKLIIIDTIIEPEGEDPWNSARLRLDLLMLAHGIGGMERTKQQLKKILEEGGFPNHKIIKHPNLFSVIEAYPA